MLKEPKRIIAEEPSLPDRWLIGAQIIQKFPVYSEHPLPAIPIANPSQNKIYSSFLPPFENLYFLFA